MVSSTLCVVTVVIQIQSFSDLAVIITKRAVKRNIKSMQTCKKLWWGTAQRLFRQVGNETVDPTLMGYAQTTAV